MAESYVQVNRPVSLGVRLKTWTSTEGTDVVHSEAVTLTDSAGDEVILYPDATLGTDPDIMVTGVAAQVLAANPARVQAVIQNTGPVNVRIGGIGVTANNGIRLVPNGSATFQMPFCYTGAVYAVSEGANSAVSITESEAG